MSTEHLQTDSPIDLGQGLLCRWSTRADQQAIAQLMATVFRGSSDEPLSPRLVDETRLLMSDGFPFMGPGDFAVVEDAGRPERPLVACTCLFRHRWSLAGIPFDVGRPEVVATLPEYRNRGLVRALFALVHARSAAEGHLVQAITGIPYFYRQFGYEYVLDLGGHRIVDAASIPAQVEAAPEPYTLRLARLEDIPDLMQLYNVRCRTSLVWHEPDEAYWRYQILSWEAPAVQGSDATTVGMERRLYMIVDTAGDSQGYIWPAVIRRHGALAVAALELRQGANWQAVMPSVLRGLQQLGAATPSLAPDTSPFNAIRFALGRTHPAYDLLGEHLAPRYLPPYAWYLRVADVPAFLRHIAPVLEARLAGSLLAGYTGELKIDHYRGGLRLAFAEGKLAAMESWRAPAYGDHAHVGCPPLVFLQLLFGYRSLAELRAVFPDVWSEDDASLLIDTLFPKAPSTVYALG